jgi:hypothetical protein
LCQRYYYKIQTTAANQDFGNGYNITTTNSDGNCVFKVSMRTGPTALETTGTATDYRIRNLATTTICSSIPQILGTGTTESCGVRFIVASGLTAGGGAILRSETSSAYLAWSAEL